MLSLAEQREASREQLEIRPLQAAQYRLETGDFYLRMGQKNEAETLYQAVVSEFPEFEWGLLRWARYQAESGHVSEAEEYYRRIIQLDGKADPDAVESAKEDLKALKLRGKRG
ncbi:hypothetical protein SY88_00835 [Clostridiales bacterium PH28_bin88]|nr:hypothetical protein SY88_00835 [Clostridiales bacterium PH28_bin88]